MAAVMNSSANPSTFLPTVKCSNCNARIEISLTGEHVCPQVAPLRGTQHHQPDSLLSSSMSGSANPTFIALTTSQQASRIHSSDADNSVIPLHQLDRPYGPRSDSRNHPSHGRHQARFENPGRSAVALSRNRPPSPETSTSQTCAFPPFPNARWRSPAPAPPSNLESSFSFARNDHIQGDTASSFAPLSPRGKGGSILTRMDSITPGPFDLNNKGKPRSSGHMRTSTVSSSHDFVYPSRAGSGKGHSKRPSTAGSDLPRNAPLSNTPEGPGSILDQTRLGVPDFPPEHFQPQRSRTFDVVQTGASWFDPAIMSPIAKFPPKDRSETYPLKNPVVRERLNTKPEGPSKLPRPVASPSVAAAIRPLHEIGSISSFKSCKERMPSPSGELSTKSPSHTARRREPSKIKKPPPLPIFDNAHDYVIENPYHTPADSISSDESIRSDTRTGSSMSSPPLSGSPQRHKRRPSNASQNGNPTTKLDFGLESIAFPGGPLPRAQPSDSGKSMSAKPTISIKPGALGSSMALDPAIQSARPFLPVSWSSPISSHLGSPTSPAAPRAPPSPAPKASPGHRGRCRGCKELIVGKSVSSADGQLTGRYHKSCFVCTTCQAPFQTADFYLLDNKPYCGPDYHVLNGSLCTSCDCGIEGQYVETEGKQKFHPACFTCQDCHGILRDDYFELNGRRYCEKHVLQAAHQTQPQPQPQQQPLPSARASTSASQRHPERRTTRLLTMA